MVVSLRLMSGKNQGFFNLLVGTLRSERGTEKAPRCLVTSGRKFTKEAQGRTVWIQHEQLTLQEGKTLFVALFYFGVFGFFLFQTGAFEQTCVTVPAGQSKGAESRALSAVPGVLLAVHLPPAPNPPGCWGRGVKTSPLRWDSYPSPGGGGRAARSGAGGSPGRARCVPPTQTSLQRSWGEWTQGRWLVEIITISFLKVGMKIWESLKVHIYKGSYL